MPVMVLGDLFLRAAPLPGIAVSFGSHQPIWLSLVPNHLDTWLLRMGGYDAVFAFAFGISFTFRFLLAPNCDREHEIKHQHIHIYCIQSVGNDLGWCYGPHTMDKVDGFFFGSITSPPSIYEALYGRR